MKTQNFVRRSVASPSYIGSCMSAVANLNAFSLLEDYREKRENGNASDTPARPFPNLTPGLDYMHLGFMQQCDYQKGCPDDRNTYWYIIQYTEFGDIKAWMEEKDFNYLRRIQRENPALYQQELAELKAANPAHPAIKQLALEVEKEQAQQAAAAEKKRQEQLEAERLAAAKIEKQRAMQQQLKQFNTGASNMKSVQSALEKQDIEMIKYIAEDESNDIKAWSFIGVDLSAVEPGVKERLQEKGALLGVPELIKTSEYHLSIYKGDPNGQRRYIRRLSWGVERLLGQWATQDKLLDKHSAQQLDDRAKAEFRCRHEAYNLPERVQLFISEKREEQLQKIFAQWKSRELSPKHSKNIDETITDALWYCLSVNKETDDLNHILTPEIQKKVSGLLLGRLKSKDLTDSFSRAWKKRLAENVSDGFHEETVIISEELSNAIVEKAKIIVEEKHRGKFPRNMGPIYDEAIDGLLEEWLLNHTTKSVSVEMDKFATEVRADMQLDADLRQRVEKEAITLVVEDYKSGNIAAYDRENIIEDKIKFSFDAKLSSLCANVKVSSFYDLQEQIITNALDNAFAEWRDNPRKFEDMSLVDLLPELQSISSKLKNEADLASKHRTIAALEKEVAALRSSSAAARQIGFMAGVAGSNNDLNLTSEGEKPETSFGKGLESSGV